MTGLGALIRRNVKLYFKDKGMFFTSLITPMILLVLYSTFLGNVYRDSFVSAIPPLVQLPNKLINATVGGQLISSLLAISCVTVTFCCNMLMVQDKVTGARRDLMMTPAKPSNQGWAAKRLSIHCRVGGLSALIMVRSKRPSSTSSPIMQLVSASARGERSPFSP